MVIAEGLELGNPRLFGASWASYGDLNFRNVRVTAQMKFLRPFVDDPPNTVAWMGVGLRASHYYARYSHLVYLRRDGQLRRTEFLPSGDKVPDDPIILSLPAATSVENTLIELSAEMRENVLSIGLSVDSSPLPPIPPIQIENYVFSRGRVLIQAYRCRVLLRSILVEEL